MIAMKIFKKRFLRRHAL